jgi:hypothetical protein
MEVEGGELCNVVALETVVLYVILQPYVFGTLNRGAGSYESFPTVRTRRQASEDSSRFFNSFDVQQPGPRYATSERLPANSHKTRCNKSWGPPGFPFILKTIELCRQLAVGEQAEPALGGSKVQ